MKNIKLYIALACSLLLAACTGLPEGAQPVKPFELDLYLGKWYEIARLDHSFERGLNNVTASYSLMEDGVVKVENRGFDSEKNKWKDAVGKARPIGDPGEGRLKVSFFGPFYSGYNIIALDKEYRYALVVGNKTKYLWILSREKSVPAGVREDYLRKARTIGCDTTALIWVKHDL